jgi:hypothetical protein
MRHGWCVAEGHGHGYDRGLRAMRAVATRGSHFFAAAPFCALQRPNKATRSFLQVDDRSCTRVLLPAQVQLVQNTVTGEHFEPCSLVFSACNDTYLTFRTLAPEAMVFGFYHVRIVINAVVRRAPGSGAGVWRRLVFVLASAATNCMMSRHSPQSARSEVLAAHRTPLTCHNSCSWLSTLPWCGYRAATRSART